MNSKQLSAHHSRRIVRAVTPTEEAESSLAQEIQKQINKAVHTSTRKLCTNKGQICVQGPPGKTGPQGLQGPMGPPGMKGQKGEPGEPTSTSLQLFRGEPGSIISTPEILVKPAVKTVTLNESATFQCSPERKVNAKISWAKEGGSLPTGRHSIVKGTLHIKNVIVGDNGMYVCTIRTDQGTAQATVTLNVRGMSRKIQCHFEHNTSSINKGN